MDPSGLIIYAEEQFKNILEGFFLTVYDENMLPSHGIEHHRRVWRYAAELVSVLDIPKDNSFINSLIIASYLHDAGMASEPGPRHGWKSAELCQSFLEINDLKENDFPGLIDAINEHDNKEYIENNGDLLLKILSLADDLDAFGFTGIYRYLEIYFHRDIDPVSVSSIIRSNAANRFRNFSDSIPVDSSFFKKHLKRFTILDDFFQSCEKKQPGYYETLEIIMHATLSQKGYKNFVEQSYDNPVMTWLADGLSKEMGI